MDELNLYNIGCNNIQDIIDGKNSKENTDLNELLSNNDKKNRGLRITIMNLRKENSELKSQLKVLKEVTKISTGD